MLRVCVLTWLCCALVGAWTRAARGQPANDICAQAMTGFAIPPGGGTVSGTLAGASRDAMGTTCPSNQTGPDVYHTITPTASGVYTFETCGGAAWDTVLSVHTACPASAANQLPQACNDDACGTQSRVSALLSAGQTYIVRVGAYASTSAVGAYTLLVGYSAPVTNDECGSTNPLLALDVATTGSSVGATTTLTITPSTFCGAYTGSGGGGDVFFRFVPPTSGGYTFSTCGSSFDTVLSVHSACPVAMDNLIGCNDDGPSGFCAGGALTSLVYATLTGQHTYFVRVAGYAGTVAASGMVVVTAHRDQNAIVTGACCADSAGGPMCEARPQSECVGTYQGDNTSCVPDPCEVEGACCLSDGTCMMGRASACPGVYQGDASACGTMACPQPTGVCCIGAVCLIVLPADCVSPGAAVGALWVGGNQCNASATVNGPCCRADFNKSGTVTVQDIFDYLNAWFAGSPFTHLAAPGQATIQDIFDFLTAWFAGGC